MPTLSQLQFEIWWQNERVTPAVNWLGDNLCARTGRPRNAFGAKGDQYHLKGAHRSQNWILRSRFATNRTYTVQSGLAETQKDEIAGVDFTPGTKEEMLAQSRRIYNAMRAGLLPEVFEFYGNINGDQIVDGWDNIDDENITSDASHLWHWHLTLDRRQLNNMELMRRILAIALGDPMTQPDVALTAAQNTALSQTWAAEVALRDGKLAPASQGHAGGPHWTVQQIALAHQKLDSLLSMVGALTVAVAEIENRLDNPVITIAPVQVTGELRFNEMIPADTDE